MSEIVKSCSRFFLDMHQLCENFQSILAIAYLLFSLGGHEIGRDKPAKKVKKKRPEGQPKKPPAAFLIYYSMNKDKLKV